MSALTELIKEQAQRLAQPDVKTQLDRWIQSEQALIEKLEAWLKEADPDGALKLAKTNHLLREEKWGSYDAVYGMTIDLGGRRVEITPRGGAVGGAVRLDDGQTAPIRGFVEMTNDIDQFRLFRLVDETGERWVIKPEMSAPARPLNQSTFEEAMVQLFS